MQGDNFIMAYYKTTVEAGATIEVYKSFTKRRPETIPRSKKSKATSEEIEKINQLNAERKLRIKINNNFSEGDPYITLTYKQNERPTPDEAKDRVKKFLSKLREVYKKHGMSLKYINVTEYENASIHHHLLINDLPNINITKTVNRLWKSGRPNYKFLDDTGQYKNLAAYFIKETSESFKKNKETGKGHKQRWSNSRNLIMPPSRTEIIRNAVSWIPDPRPKEGYYIDQDTIVNGVDPFTGRMYQRYTMVKISGCRGG